MICVAWLCSGEPAKGNFTGLCYCVIEFMSVAVVAEEAQLLGKLCIASAAKDCSMPVKKSLFSKLPGLDWVGGRQRCQLISISEKTNVGQDVICLSLWLLMVFPTQ